jgi:hypothetical protein
LRDQYTQQDGYTSSMDAELSAYRASIDSRIEQICAGLDGLTAAQLNYRPPMPGANSAWVLATHTLGNACAWALGIACGQPQRRDRPAEFASAGGDAAAFRADAAAFSREMAVAFTQLAPADLDRRFVPAKESWGESEPHEINVRLALLQVVEHASLHLGHLQATRDLALAQA